MSNLLLLNGDACHIPLADQSINTICTSPPYYGLRAYSGVEPSYWPGGSYRATPSSPPTVIPGPTPEEMAACAHVWEPYSIPPPGHTDNGITSSTLQGGKSTQAQTQRTPTTGATCQRCGAWKGTLGNEPTVERFLWHTLLWLREVKRVLRDDGVVWCVIADSFSSGGGYWPDASSNQAGSKQSTNGGSIAGRHGTTGYPAGSLLGIPGLLHQAALADGWVVRDNVDWIKVSPMPESIRGSRWQHARCGCVQSSRLVTGTQGYATQNHRENSCGLSNTPQAQPDPTCPQCHGTGRLAERVLRRGSWRHTRATEVVLMLTKGMSYFANSEAVREAQQSDHPSGNGFKRLARLSYQDTNGARGQDAQWFPSTAGRNPRNYYQDALTPTAQLTSLLQYLTQHCPEVLEAYHEDAQNPVNVLRPKPFSLNMAHFAAFPPGLLTRLILATCPERCCLVCQQGWAPVVEHGELIEQRSNPGQPAHLTPQGYLRNGGSRCGILTGQAVLGLLPTCDHYCTCASMPCTCGKLPLTAYVAGITLDCFAGSGTTLEVARELGRRAVGVDASYSYLSTIARERLGLAALAQWESLIRAYGEELVEEALETGITDPDVLLRYDDLPLFRGR